MPYLLDFRECSACKGFHHLCIPDLPVKFGAYEYICPSTERTVKTTFDSAAQELTSARKDGSKPEGWTFDFRDGTNRATVKHRSECSILFIPFWLAAFKVIPPFALRGEAPHGLRSGIVPKSAGG